MSGATPLAGLLRAVELREVVGDPAPVNITSVVHDSRHVEAGALFCCIPGNVVDGHDFAPAAVAAGAVGLLCERALPVDVVQAVVPSTRVAIGPIAAAFHGEPSRSVDVVGITGTNGKTTTAHLLHEVLEGAGRNAAIIGTLTGTRTTPEATELQASMAAMRDEGVQAIAMEVSSHALDQHRVDGTWFRVAVFTNLSRDHLDYHGSMNGYFEAKQRLFTPERCAHAVVNIDDPWGRKLADGLTIPWEPCSLGLVDDVQINGLSSRCRWRGVELRVPMGGRFNLLNALAAATAAEVLGLEPHEIARGLGEATSVQGRFEPVDAGQPFRVIVDYAHTPDGLEQLLMSAREMAGTGQVVLVFGAGGNRDNTKRAPMGAVAVRLADRVVLTSDNPRREDPGAIIEDVLSGIDDPSAVVVEPDRRAAIATAIGLAQAGDIVIVAGKGHETTQTIGDDVLPFDDRVVARELLEAESWSAS